MSELTPQPKKLLGFCLSILIITFLSFGVQMYGLYLGDYDLLNLSMIAVLVIVTILMIIDREALKERYPDRQIFSGWSIIFVPAYLYLRSKFVREKQYLLLSWIGLVMVGTSVTYYIEKAYDHLPSCADVFVISELQYIVEQNGYGLLKMSNMHEISADIENRTRTCESNVFLASMDNIPDSIQYKISWSEILGAWDIHFLEE